MGGVGGELSSLNMISKIIRSAIDVLNIVFGLNVFRQFRRSYLITIRAINTISSTITIGIHTGANTHIQLHEIYPSSFRAIKRMVSNPKNPIPLLLLTLFFFPIVICFRNNH